VFFALSKSVDALLSPLFVAISFAVMAFVLSFRQSHRSRRGSQLLVGLAILVLYVFSLESVSNGLWYIVEKNVGSTAKDDQVYDVVVVLGGITNSASSETWGSTDYGGAVERLLRAYDLLRLGRAKRVLISCGITNKDASSTIESHVVADQLAEWGIDRSRILIEDRSRNTRENAVESAKIIREQGFASILLVTSASHMRRASACFRAVGLDFDVLPVDYHSFDTSKNSTSKMPRAHALDDSTSALREIFGYWVYRAKGYAKED
jgi:uncharacterized SAM-binding protein YcdF (DUF218 family)